jgi:hypothetical protein
LTASVCARAGGRPASSPRTSPAPAVHVGEGRRVVDRDGLAPALAALVDPERQPVRFDTHHVVQAVTVQVHQADVVVAKADARSVGIADKGLIPPPLKAEREIPLLWQHQQVRAPVAVHVGELHPGVAQVDVGGDFRHRPRGVEPAVAQVTPEPGGAVHLDEVGQAVAEQAHYLEVAVRQRARRQRVVQRAHRREACVAEFQGGKASVRSPSWPTTLTWLSSNTPLNGRSSGGRSPERTRPSRYTRS